MSKPYSSSNTAHNNAATTAAASFTTTAAATNAAASSTTATAAATATTVVTATAATASKVASHSSTALSEREHQQLVQSKLQDQQMRANLTAAMHTLQHNRSELIAHKYLDWQGLRVQAQAVKNNALQNLSQRLEEFEKHATANGIHVHWASSAEDACTIIFEIIKQNNVQHVLKGKSMASEEIGLNAFLRKHGVIAEETDLGELILQLNHEPPVHIVVPAIHRNRHEVAEIFAKNLGVPAVNEIEKLNAIARDHLRAEFAGLKLGISGVNFALAQEGAIWLIENEGNGRMCTTAPDIHVALCGIEKVVGSMEDAACLMHLLTPSATGQFIPAYQNIITGPRKQATNTNTSTSASTGASTDTDIKANANTKANASQAELDGPKEVHVVLFDHHRSNMIQDPDFAQALRCLRCGACMNFCPVYDKIGGHSYHTTYPGPIGEVISPQLFGLDQVGDILSFCSQCQRCSEVCPERIPLAQLIRTLRAFKNKQISEEKRGANLSGYAHTKENKAKTLAMRLFVKAATNGLLWRFALGHAYAFNFIVQRFGPYLPVSGQWAQVKALPQLRENFYSELKKLDDLEIED